MANKEHLKILKQGADAWNDWREREPETQADLSGLTLNNENLFKVNLKEVNLKWTDLSEASLYGENLCGADLTGANLSKSNLSEADLSRANLRKANLSEASLYAAHLVQANLIEANLTKSDLSWANLSESNFDKANLSLANLSKANLSKAELPWADFRWAILSEANLSEASLFGANLLKADLTSANLEETQLQSADFSGANLRKANLSNAHMVRANLSNIIDLSEANLSQAEVASTIFANIDLSAVNGLDLVKHFGPSSVGIDTIYLSKGHIPEIFLRGAGLPDNFITYVQSLTEAEQAIQFYSCFISYSHADKSFARRLYDALQGQGIRCWLDEHQLLPGQNIYAEVDRGIRLWDKILLCCSENSLISWWVDNEINSAFAKEQNLWRQHAKEILALIPLNLDGYMFSKQWESGKALQIKSRLAADFTGWEYDNNKFEVQFGRLVRALRIADEGREQPPKSNL
jgi:uncharacterized protein YjbI with pentapeptide repeats